MVRALDTVSTELFSQAHIRLAVSSKVVHDNLSLEALTIGEWYFFPGQ